MASPVQAMGTSMDPTTTTTTTTTDTAAFVEEPSASSVDPPASSAPSGSEVETPATSRSLMGPPPPENPSNPNTEPPPENPSIPNTEPSPENPSIPNIEPPQSPSANESAEKQPPQSPSANEFEHDSAEKQPPHPQDSSRSKQRQSQNVEVPYTIPQWSEAPSYPFQLEVLKDGSIIDQLDVTKKGAYMFGRIDICDFVLEHPTISRFHAVLQFKGNGDAYLYDLESTHGTSINKIQVKQKVYVKLHVGDVIRFGLSSRLYIFQGPTELMPPEADLTNVNYVKDREASLRRAREDAALADGISWGMREDAIEEAEDDSDEVTWQNYKGELTEKQQKTREKVLKRTEKIAHMKKEISAIRAKDIAQGGLTQGQQTQIARNELRISEIFEELESLEETLNDSIRESLGARTGRSSLGRQRGPVDEEDEFLSDDDEFYDRTKKKSANKAADTQSIETADSLLDKQEALMKEMEVKRGLLVEEKNKMSESGERDAGDALDAFMSGLSSQLVIDRTVQLEKDLSSLQTELDRIVYLLKIADPTGEAAKKRQTTAQELKSNESASFCSSVKRSEQAKIKLKKVKPAEKPMTISSAITEQAAHDVAEEASAAQKHDVEVTDPTEKKPTVYQAVKPQWLGAVQEDRERKESQQEKQLITDEDGGGDEFVDYKDRKKILDSDLENAAPGLILRKKKKVDKTEASEDEPSNPSSSGPAGAEMMVEDAVALLLKHKRGLQISEEDAAILGVDDGGDQKQSGQDNKRPKRVLGPEKPAFLENRSDYETWVPPEGQSGDGRTSLNDRLGY